MLCRLLTNSGLSKRNQGRPAAYKPPHVEPNLPEVLQAIQVNFNNQNSTLMQTIKDSEKDSKGQPFQQLDECCKNMFEKLKGDYFNICIETKHFFDAWIRQRQSKITGTTCYKAVHLHEQQ
ncbi:hypothetical protein TKK_0014446 [Trichogramma kaykai]|uniref:Uncharacterized protein n=1 Tax=Trichogramma kaykai TaxID=54128 RepID=A0ABD2WDB2_9HYME